MSSFVRVRGFDHLVLHVSDPAASLEWYTSKLGLSAHRVDEYLAGTVPFPSVEICPGTVIDLDGRKARTGENVAHFCLEIDEVDFAAFVDQAGFDSVDGPYARWGARGVADLVYVRDPDDNIIELRHYGPSVASYHGPDTRD